MISKLKDKKSIWIMKPGIFFYTSMIGPVVVLDALVNSRIFIPSQVTLLGHPSWGLSVTCNVILKVRRYQIIDGQVSS